MKFGILPPYRTGLTADPEWMTAFAQHAEAVGFESIFTVEHLVVPVGYTTRYPYAESGRMPLPDDVAIPDPLELLAFLAACTTTLVLGTGVLVLPAHHPVQLAKRLATIDVLSGGRMLLGVGVGWMREELEAMNVDPTTRGERTDECIAALRALWCEDEPTFAGRWFRFERARSHPKPVRPGGIPIQIGGHSEAAACRAGRVGDGYHPLGLDGAQLTARLETVRRAADAAGRDADAIEVSLGGLLDRTDLAAVDEARAAGAHRMILSTREPDIDRACEQLSSFASDVIDRH